MGAGLNQARGYSTASGINIDKTQPGLVFEAPSPSANANGWNRTDVAFAFTASDALSGVETTSLPSPLVLTSEGSAVSGTVEVTDLAGNTASFASAVVKIDKTNPVVTGSRSPSANAYGWNAVDVTVSVTATDALSGAETCEPEVVVSAEGASQSVTRSCTDYAGNSASDTVAGISIDKTAPVVTGSPARPTDRNGWYNHAVAVTWSGDDPLSGVLNSLAKIYENNSSASIQLVIRSTHRKWQKRHTDDGLRTVECKSDGAHPREDSHERHAVNGRALNRPLETRLRPLILDVRKRAENHRPAVEEGRQHRPALD